MKPVRSIFVWLIGLVYFGLFCIFIIFLSYFFNVRKLDKLIRFMLKVLFKIMFIKVESEGDEKLDSHKTYLFMANHVSLFDVPLLKAYIPVYVIGVEAHHQFEWPLYGHLIKRLKAIPIERDDIHASIRSIKKTLKTIRQNKSVVIMPEGHRTLNGQMQPLKKLPFHLAKKAEVDLVPIGLSGLFSLKPKKTWQINPGRIKIKFGEIITKEHLSAMTAEEIRDEVYIRIQALIEFP